MLSPGLVKVAKHPEHGHPVDYQPGQLLPAWLTEALENGALLRPVSDGVFELVMPTAKPQGRKPRTEKMTHG